MSTKTRTRVAQQRPNLPARGHWPAAAESWAQSLEDAGRTPNTIDGYSKHLGWLAGDLANACPDPWELTPAHLGEWLDAQHWSAATRARVLVSIRSFYTFGVLAGICRRSPLSGVNTPPPRVRGPKRSTVPAPWVHPLADYLGSLRASARTDGTIDRRREHVARFAQSHSEPWSVTYPDLARWLSRSDWSPAYKRTIRSSLRSFYGWATKVGHTPTNPARDLDPVRQRRTLPRPAPDDAVNVALGRADDRTRLAIQFGIYAGLRRAEVAALHTRDIGEHSLRVIGKGDNERLVPLHPDLAVILRAELKRRREATNLGTGWGRLIPAADGWLFPSDDPDQHLRPRRIGDLIAEALPPGWTAHTLRHRFATQAYQGTRDLRAVQELLGHSKPEVTARYAAVADGALHQAVLNVGPTTITPGRNL